MLLLVAILIFALGLISKYGWSRGDIIFITTLCTVSFVLFIVGLLISATPYKENNLKAEKSWETIDENLKENYDIVEFSPILTDNNCRGINLKRWVQTAIEGDISNPMKINALTDKGNLITWEITIMPEENKILLMNKENESVSPAEYLIE